MNEAKARPAQEGGKKYKAIVYIRLSVADDKGKVESDSVGNQRKLIDEWLKSHPEIEVVGEAVEACDIIEPNPGSRIDTGFQAIWFISYYAQGLIPRPSISRT